MQRLNLYITTKQREALQARAAESGGSKTMSSIIRDCVDAGLRRDAYAEKTNGGQK